MQRHAGFLCHDAQGHRRLNQLKLCLRLRKEIGERQLLGTVMGGICEIEVAVRTVIQPIMQNASAECAVRKFHNAVPHHEDVGIRATEEQRSSQRSRCHKWNM